MEQGKETEKNKEMNYKNYYNELSHQQRLKQDSYVSPFSQADTLKEALINKGIDQDRQRYLHADQESRLREAEKRNQYRNELLHQIEERRHKEVELKNLHLLEKETFQNQTKSPLELARYEKEKKRKEV